MKIDIFIATNEAIEKLANWPLIQHDDWQPRQTECPFCRKTAKVDTKFYHVKTCLVLAARQEIKRRRNRGR